MDLINQALLLFQPTIGSALSSSFSKFDQKWYNSLKKPVLTPPNIVFPIAWTILYILLGVNALLIYNSYKSKNRPSLMDNNFKNYMIVYEIQLILNFIWGWVFFGLRNLKMALLIVGVMIILTIYLLIQSWNVNRTAFWVLVPYFIWISFAAYLNFYIAF
jgi:tryptophan-rich sensory protein